MKALRLDVMKVCMAEVGHVAARCTHTFVRLSLKCGTYVQ